MHWLILEMTNELMNYEFVVSNVVKSFDPQSIGISKLTSNLRIFIGTFLQTCFLAVAIDDLVLCKSSNISSKTRK